jgi:hypothetical protein
LIIKITASPETPLPVSSLPLQNHFITPNVPIADLTQELQSDLTQELHSDLTQELHADLTQELHADLT